MAKVGILTKDQNDQLYMDYREGEIYKEFGIVETLSAGKMRGTVIHLKSGRIVSDLCALEGKEVAKKHIDYTEHALRGNWDYEAIKHRFQDTIPFQAISLWGEVEVEGTFVDGFAVIRSFEAKTYDVLDIESKQVIPHLTAPTPDEARMNIYHVHHLIHAGMPFNEIVKNVENVIKKRKKEEKPTPVNVPVDVTDVMEMHSTIVVIKQRQKKVVKLARQLLDEAEHLGGVIEALEADYQLLKAKTNVPIEKENGSGIFKLVGFDDYYGKETDFAVAREKAVRLSNELKKPIMIENANVRIVETIYPFESNE